jgi:hypothetical protein
MREGFLYCVLYVVNVEPVDLSLRSFLYCVLYVVNVEPVDISLPSFLVLYVWCSTLTTYKTQYRNEGRDRSTGSTLITHKIQEMREVIGQTVQHWSHIKHKKWTYHFPHFLYFMCDQCWTGWPIPSLISILCFICGQCWTGWPIPFLISILMITHKTQEMREGIGQPVQHWSHIKYNIEMREGIGQPVQHWSHIKHNIEM